MKTLTEFLNEAKLQNKADLMNNVFFSLYKSNSPEEFKAKILEIKSKVVGKSLNTKKNKYTMGVRNPKDGVKIETSSNLNVQAAWSYSLSSSSSDENKYFIAFCTDDIEGSSSGDGIIEFSKHPRIYFGNNKKFIEYKWNYVFNDVGWNYYGGRKGINAAEIPASEIYEMPEDLVKDCIQDLDTFKNKTKTYKP